MKKSFFFGNYFYGLCAVALSIQTSLEQHYTLPPIIYYLVLFCAVVLFYTKAYIAQTIGSTANERSVWYVNHNKQIFSKQVTLTVLTVIFGLLLLPNIYGGFVWLSYRQILFLLSFFAAGLLYYGFTKNLSLRNTHWLKPLIIAYVWSGLVTIYPIAYYQLQHQQIVSFSKDSLFAFFQNFIYITVLCILFDIKDYATDFNNQLKTFVVCLGLRKTIYYIVTPIAIIGLGCFLSFAFWQHFTIQKVLLYSIPFVALLYVSFSLQKRKSILYYLFVIDGLMLVKALCGIVACIL